MKRFCRIVLIFIMLLSITSCTLDEQGSPTNTPTSTPTNTHGQNDDKGTEILNDTQFYKGFNLLGLNSAIDGAKIYKKIRYGKTLGTPQWQIAQWWSKYDLKDGKEFATDKQYSLKDASKSVSVDMNTYDLTLGVNAEHEFDTYNETVPKSWPHLLIEQSLPVPMVIKDTQSLKVKLSFVIDKVEDKRESNKKGLQAQFAWFIYIVDKNPKSKGYGNFLWFGLNIFDSNNDFANEYKSQDTAGGPGNFIYSLGATEFFDTPIEVSVEKNIDIDILPHIREALALAQERGFMPNTVLDDLSVTGTNIGWEVFDRWNVAVTIRDIAIKMDI